MAELNRIVTIQRRVVSRGAFGSEVESWDDLDVVWARVNQMGVSEEFENNSDREQALRNAQLRIRYREDVDETMRVLYQEHAWDIVGIAELRNRRFLNLFCQTEIGGQHFVGKALTLHAGLSADMVAEASEFTLNDVAGVVTFPAFASMHVLLWRLETEPDIASVIFDSDPTRANQVTGFTKQAAALEVSGEIGNVWKSNQILTFAQETVVEVA